MALHLAFEIETQPLPLQAFMPLQPWPACAHEPWPLHELTPTHLTLAVLIMAAFAGARTELARMAENAAAARAAPDFETWIIIFLIGCFAVSLPHVHKLKNWAMTCQSQASDETRDQNDPETCCH